jgi:hypothetical protein
MTSGCRASSGPSANPREPHDLADKAEGRGLNRKSSLLIRRNLVGYKQGSGRSSNGVNPNGMSSIAGFIRSSPDALEPLATQRSPVLLQGGLSEAPAVNAATRAANRISSSQRVRRAATTF